MSNMLGNKGFFNLLVVIIAVVYVEALNFKHRHFHTVASRNCPEYDESVLTLSIKNFKISTYNFGQRVETLTTYRLKKEIDDLKMIAKILRCNDSSDIRCENFYEKATISDICDIIEMENTAWSNYLSTFTPRISKCPIKEGIYVSTHETGKTDDIDLSAWFSDGLWKMHNILYSGHQIVGCFETTIEIYTPLQ